MKRLLKSIKSGKFCWEKYLNGGSYCGMLIMTTPLHCSYGQIGYVVTVDGRDRISYDWELNEIDIME